MSNFFESKSLLESFPTALSASDQQLAIASSVAAELETLYMDCDLLSIYARIDELDEKLLDILAHDFKIDWWDGNYSVDEKRLILKKCWSVHRIIGTPSAVNNAISAVYNSAKVQEWWEYNGNPYHYKLIIDTGGKLPNQDKLKSVIGRIKYYVNLRSRLESVKFNIEKKSADPNIYVGTAIQNVRKSTSNVSGIDPEDYTWMVDETGAYLIDGTGELMFE